MTTRAIAFIGVLTLTCTAHAQTQPSTRRYQRGAGAYDRPEPRPTARIPQVDPIEQERKQLAIPGVEIVGAPMRVGRQWVANDDLTSFAWIESGGGAMRVNFNGRREPVYHEVKLDSPHGSLSADGGALAYVAIKAD